MAEIPFLSGFSEGTGFATAEVAFVILLVAIAAAFGMSRDEFLESLGRKLASRFRRSKLVVPLVETEQRRERHWGVLIARLVIWVLITGATGFLAWNYFLPVKTTAVEAPQFAPTSLRVQFNDNGERPQEISSQNVDWSWDTIASSTQTLLPPCPSGTIIQINCSSIASSQYNYENKTIWIIFLAFLTPLSQAYDVKVDGHGAKLPEWHSYQADNRMVYLEFEGDLTRMVVDINVIKKQ